MASTALVRDVLWRVSVLLTDTAPQFQRFTQKELVHWLNDGQVALAKYLPESASRVDAVKLAPGTKQSIDKILAADCLPGDGSSPTTPIYGTQVLDLVRLMGADGQTPGAAVAQTERKLLDAQSPTWHTLTGSPESWTFDPRMPRVFYVVPGVPATPDTWAEIAYTAQPIAIANAGSEDYTGAGSSVQTISVNDEHVDDLTDYVTARASLKDSKYADKSAATFFTNRFLGSLNAKVKAVRGYDPNLQDLPLAQGGRP